MIYQIKGGFFEEMQKSKVFIEIGIDRKTLKKKSTWRAIIKELIEKYNHDEIEISEGAHNNNNIQHLYSAL